MAAASNAASADRTVLVSNLPGECTQETLQRVFSTYGQIVSALLRPAGADGLRTAVVIYDDEEAAEDAEEVLDGKYSMRRDNPRPICVKRQSAQPIAPKSPQQEEVEPLHPAMEVEKKVVQADSQSAQLDKPSRELAVKEDIEAPPWNSEACATGWLEEEPSSTRVWTQNGFVEGHKLWVGSLPPDIKQEELMLVFSTYGKVVEIKIHGTKHPRGKGAFVTYATRESGEDAIEVLHGVYRIRPTSPWPMEVRWAHPNTTTAAVAVATTPVKGGGVGSSWHGFGGGGSDDWHDRWWGGEWWDWRGGWDNYWEANRSSSSGKGGNKKSYVERPCPNCSCVVRFYLDDDRVSVTRTAERSKGVGDPEDSGGQNWERGKGGNSAANSAAGSASSTSAPLAVVAPSGGQRPPGPVADAAQAQCPPTSPGPAEAAEEEPRRVHVFENLPDSVDEKGLRWVFEQYGKVVSLTINKDEARPGCAHAFIDYDDAYDAETSVLTLDGEYEIRKGFGPIRAKLTPNAAAQPY